MKAIVAVDCNWGIGRNNDLLFHLPEDMKYFREKTLGSVVVMGSNTLKSFPGGNPLPGRTNVVLYPGGEAREDCRIVQSLFELAEVLKTFGDREIFVIGGAMFYRTMLPYCEEVLVTKVEADGNAEVFFENLDVLPGWTCAEEGERVVSREGVAFRFCRYRNLEVKEFGDGH